MSDELEPWLRREFAQRTQPLEGQAFTARVTARLGAPSGGRVLAVAATMLRGALGSAALVRLRYGRLMLLGATVLTLWVSFV